MDDDKRSFWTSVPGILTGLAAVIAAVGSIYLGVIRDHKGEREAAPTAPSQPKITTKPVAHTEWPAIETETFTEVASRWTVGSIPSENAGLDLRIVEGKYRWDVLIKKPTSRLIESPHGSVVDFYVAVDARLLASTATEPQISLLFGRNANKDYGFTVAKWSTGARFWLTRFDGKVENVITWTPTPVKLEDVNRLAVLVENGTIKLFLNSSLVGNYNDPSFTGGKIALDVGAMSAGSVVVDFDNFELRSRPQ